MRSITTAFVELGLGRPRKTFASVVFLEAWRKRRQVKFEGESVLPWLLAVANNSIRNGNRSLRRYRRLLTKLPRAVAIPDQSDEAIGRIDALDEELSQSDRYMEAEAAS